MVVVRSATLAITFFLGMALATPLQAQTSATLSITARVVQQCTVSSKRELVSLARRLNDPSLLRTCSIGVVNRVDERLVKYGDIRQVQLASPSVSNASISRQQIVRTNPNGQTDVVLVTVTY